MSDKYDDIINMPHHISRKHKQMPLADRAAQFSPFAALTGYEDTLKETARQTDVRINLTEEKKLVINEKIRILNEMISNHPVVSITYFVPDDKKDGGVYVTDTGIVKKIDDYKKEIIMKNGTSIQFKEILKVDSEVFHHLYELGDIYD